MTDTHDFLGRVQSKVLSDLDSSFGFQNTNKGSELYEPRRKSMSIASKLKSGCLTVTFIKLISIFIYRSYLYKSNPM